MKTTILIKPMKPLLALLAALPLCSCLSTGSTPKSYTPPTVKPTDTVVLKRGKAIWNDMADVERDLKGVKGVTIKGKVVDLNGAQLDGSKLKRYADIQREDNEPLRVNVPGLTLKDGSVRRIPGGIIVKADGVTIDDMIWLDTGEDSVSTIVDRAEGITVRNCVFYGATDKSIQLSDARNATVENNTVYGGITAVRLGDSTSKSGSNKTKSLKNNSFIGTNTVWHLSRITAKATGTKYNDVKTRYKLSNGAKFSEN